MLPNWHILPVSFNTNQRFTVEYSDTLLARAGRSHPGSCRATSGAHSRCSCFGESDGGTPQMDAKKRAEVREAVAAARRSVIKDEPMGTALNYFAYNFIKIHRTLRTS